MEKFSYNNIAKDYHLKRKKPWKPLEFFLKHLKAKKFIFKGICIDLGCANGRHFKNFKNPNSKLVGIDNSIEFLKITRENLKDREQYSIEESNNIQLLLADLCHIPIRTMSIQNIFSIATLHHIRHKNDRINVFSQILDLLKERGYFLITVWRKWQKKYKNYFVANLLMRVVNPSYRKQQKKAGLPEFGDRHVPWTVSSSSERITYVRYYHFFSKKELQKLLLNFKIRESIITGGPTGKDNFFVLAQK